MSQLTSNAARFARQANSAAIAATRVAGASAKSFAVQGVREAARLTSYPIPTDVLSAIDNGADAKITVAAHTRVYPVQGTIDVPDVAIAGGDIGGLTFATLYYVYYDDETLVDGAPVFLATTDPETAAPGTAAGRHIVGQVTTPADGAVATTGHGSKPGGWWWEEPIT